MLQIVQKPITESHYVFKLYESVKQNSIYFTYGGEFEEFNLERGFLLFSNLYFMIISYLWESYYQHTYQLRGINQNNQTRTNLKNFVFPKSHRESKQLPPHLTPAVVTTGSIRSVKYINIILMNVYTYISHHIFMDWSNNYNTRFSKVWYIWIPGLGCQ